MKVYEKLMKARLTLHGKQLKKSGHNKFAGYQYFELGDFLPTVMEIFSGLKLCGVVSYTADTAKLTITCTEGGGQVEITSPMGSAALKGCHEVQNIGAVETYQRRYLWVTAMEIVEHDVLDATTAIDRPASFKSVPQDEWDKLVDERKDYLSGVAKDVRALISIGNGAGAMQHLNEKVTDATEKVAIWWKFDSKERAAMEPHKRPKKAA